MFIEVMFFSYPFVFFHTFGFLVCVRYSLYRIRSREGQSFQSLTRDIGSKRGQRIQKNPVSIENTGFFLAQKEGFEPSQLAL